MDKETLLQQAEYLKNLDNIEKEWTEKLDKEEQIEKEIEEYSNLISERLLISKNKNTLVDIDKRKFFIGYKVEKNKQGKKVLTLVILDILLQQLIGRKSNISAIKRVEAEYVNEFNLKSNIKAAVIGWLRQETGTIKPESME